MYAENNVTVSVSRVRNLSNFHVSRVPSGHGILVAKSRLGSHLHHVSFRERSFPETIFQLRKPGFMILNQGKFLRFFSLVQNTFFTTESSRAQREKFLVGGERPPNKKSHCLSKQSYMAVSELLTQPRIHSRRDEVMIQSPSRDWTIRK